MKLRAVGFVLSAGAVAFCQSPGPSHTTSDQLFSIPQQFATNPGTILELTPIPRPPGALGNPEIRPANPAIDPQILIRPPNASLTQHGPGIPIDGSKYPRLRLLPTELARLDTPPQARMEPIPRTWRGFKMQPIPTTWPYMRMVPVESPSRVFPKAAGK